jgi:hypothetical protein
MSPRRVPTAALAAAFVSVVAVGGCSATTTGTPMGINAGTTPTTYASATPSASATTSAAPTPTGPPIGQATMKVLVGEATVTIRYRINGGAEQTETNVTLPWEKEYPVYDKIGSSVTAEGGDEKLICTIIMDGLLVAFVTEPNPTCSFAYWG